mmetsp:Transcript_16049/g.19667  ORF Transcript_16049/g.19667 Transcript_16049/m.19667 type:complete len:240 (-) Transcript_16049:31-750(-)
MVKHNKKIPNIHLHKDWQRYIRTHFDQPSKTKRRRQLRRKKAERLAPRPLRKLKPIVQCPTQRYNMKIRQGKGFSLLELKKAGLNPKYARTIGISVDVRRKNRSNEGLMRNVARLKKYQSSLVLFPKELTEDEQKDKDKMIKYYTEIAEAEAKVASYMNYTKDPMKVKNERKIAQIITLKDVPKYDAYGTNKNEWVLKKKYFRFRKLNKYKSYKKKRDAKKAAKKAAKGAKAPKQKKKK